MKNIKFEIRVTLIYFLIGIIWILFSDIIFDSIFTNIEDLTKFQIVKGTAYVFITSIFLYFFIKNHINKLRKSEMQEKLRTDLIEAHYEETKQLNEDLKKAKEKLELNENKLIEAQSLAHIGSWELDLTDNKLTWSDEVYRIFGFAPQEFSVNYDIFLSFIHPEDRDFVNESYRNHIATKKPYDIVHRIILKNDEIKYVNERCKSDFDNKGNPIRSIGTVADITEKTKAELLKLETDKRLKTLIDMAPFGSHTWEVKSNGDMIFLGENLSAKKILKADNDYLIGSKIEDAFPGLIKSGIPEIYKNVALSGEPYFTEQLTYIDKRIEGAFELHAMQIAPNIMTVFFMDITERKKAEEALRMSEIRYRRLHESIMDAIVTVDNNFFMKDVNNIFTEMLGYSKEELAGMTFYDITPEKWHSIEKEIISKEISEKGYSDVFEKEYIKKDGSVFPVELRVFLIKDDEGNPEGMIGIVRDITDRKNLETKIQNHLKDLERSNKELEQFAYVASHDLQEPLRMVSSFTQLLAQKYRDKLDNIAVDYINYAVDGANRMQRLINDLLAYSRVQTKGKEFIKVDMHIVLGQVLSMLSQTISSKNALITNGELPFVMADESQMIQLFMNLITNSIKFCSVNPVIHISALEDEKFWIFSLKDNGIGIEKQYFNKIFQIFQRLHTKDEYIGTGIGLAICQRIVERHGGKIWLESETGSGTIFYFSLPKRKEH